MKLVEMSIRNYRQFEKADISFDDGITVLAGANNSGKTSLISLIKNVFNDEKSNYCESDIPAKNLQDWISRAYPIFETFFTNDSSIEKIEEDLVEHILPKDEEAPQICIDTTRLRVHVSYNPDKDDIKLFADYIMDLDEDKHGFYFEYYYEIRRTKLIKAISKEFEKIKKRFDEIQKEKTRLTASTDEKEKHNIELKERSNLNKISYGESQFTSLYYGSLSHDDLLAFTKKVVEKYPVILKKIRDKYQLVFIDEYQDTDADVLKLFYSSMVTGTGKLYLLGDCYR